LSDFGQRDQTDFGQLGRGQANFSLHKATRAIRFDGSSAILIAAIKMDECA